MALDERRDRITDIRVDLVSVPVPSGIADATRRVEKIGYVVVQVSTAGGATGVGITYHEAGGEATAAIVERDLADLVLGRSPFDSELIWKAALAYVRGVARKGVALTAISAIDIALWDLKGKILDVPLARLFGAAASVDRVPVYASGGWTSYSDDQLVDEALQMVASGYRMIKQKVGVAGGTSWQRDVERVRLVREAIGPDVGLMLDACNCWRAATAVRFARHVEQYDPIFLEEPVMADDIPGLARFRAASPVPLATGEHEYTRWGFRDLISAGAADVVQPDVARAGGYSELLKIAAMADAWNLEMAPHAMEIVSVPLVAALDNAPYLEHLLMFEALNEEVFVDPLHPVDGHIRVPPGPGHGLELRPGFVRQVRHL